MRICTFHLIVACMATLATAHSSPAVRAEQPGRVLFDFDAPNSVDQWRTVNDSVMGGVSEGNCRAAEAGFMDFYGALSLENNGGFASVRSQPAPLELDDGDVIFARVRGDGRRYYLNMRTSTPRMAFSYRAAFQTKADTWQEVRVPLKDFRATSFGRQIPGAPSVDPSSINSIGFLLADKVAGQFELRVDWVKVVNEE